MGWSDPHVEQMSGLMTWDVFWEPSLECRFIECEDDTSCSLMLPCLAKSVRKLEANAGQNV